jgi:hypothetical protein
MWYLFLILIFIAFFCLWYYQNKGVPVWLFHQVNAQSNCRPDVLESYFKFLADNHYNTLLIRDIEQCQNNQQPLPVKSIMLTFDDGYYDNYANVFPLLKKYNLKAVIFVNTLFIADERENKEIKFEPAQKVNAELIEKYYRGEACTSPQYASWLELLEMEQSGLVEIQCHTHRHGMCIASKQLTGVIKENTFIPSDLRIALKDRVDVGTPIFKNRGELSTAGYQLTDKGIKKFQAFYFEHQYKPDFLKLAQQFIKHSFDENDMLLQTQNEFQERVKQEIALNKKLIDVHLNKNANAFAWTYGHRGNPSIAWLQSEGIKYFFTCKKGTNTRVMNPLFIYRSELRKNTLLKLKVLTQLQSNLLLGTLYRWLS